MAAPLQARASAASCPPVRVPPSPEYLNLVMRYASGEHEATVALLGSWNDDRLRCDLDNLQAAAVAVRRCRDCEDRLVFQRFSIRAAILLHADKEVREQFGSPVSEQPASCGTGRQVAVIERLAAMLVLVDAEAKVFLRRFYLAMARHAHWSHCILQAEQWARAGLRRLPGDGALLMALGIAGETHVFLTLVPAPRTVGHGPRALRQFEAQTATLGGMWEKVRRTFEEAVTADPGLHEARLRLGRVLWRLKRPELAQVRLGEVLAMSDDRPLLYLAHLFLGRVHEDKGQIAEAEKEYQAALLMQPLSEPAAVAVSHARLLRGDPGAAREVLGSVVEQGRRRTEEDPYKRYLMAHTREGQLTLAELRREEAR